MGSEPLRLRLHFLNVGHGLSVVIEAIGADKTHYGVVDSYVTGDAEPAALTKLRALGAEELSFICMTHTHADHYLGLPSIIDAYKGRIGTFYSAPLGDLLTHRDRFKKLALRLIEWHEGTDSPDEKRKAFDLIRVLHWAEHEVPEWKECGSEHAQITPEGFAGILCHNVQPPLGAKGKFVARIDNNDPLMVGTVDDNEVSVALTFALGGKAVLIGGDAPHENWDLRRRKFEARGGAKISATVVNFPHHGSKRDNRPGTVEGLFADADGTPRFGIISANGQSHPSYDLIEWQEANGVAPYCTNLHRKCGAGVLKMTTLPGIDPVLAKSLREAVVDTHVQQTCQGDITVTLDEDGTLTVTPEVANFCPHRPGSMAALGL